MPKLKIGSKLKGTPKGTQKSDSPIRKFDSPIQQDDICIIDQEYLDDLT